MAGPACGTMSLVALEALIAGVKVRCEVVVERDRHGSQDLLPQWGRHRPKVGVGGAGVPAVLYRLCRCRERSQEGQARHVAAHPRQTLGVARIVTAAARRQPCSRLPSNLWSRMAAGGGNQRAAGRSAIGWAARASAGLAVRRGRWTGARLRVGRPRARRSRTPDPTVAAATAPAPWRAPETRQAS